MSLPVRFGTVVCGAMIAMIFAGCDGNDEGRDGNVADSADDTGLADGTAADTTPEDVTSLDTALPFEVTVENHDLRNGVKARVGHVVDGDTVHVWVGTIAPKEYVIRMLGLAAPECFKDYRQTPDGSKLVCTADDEIYGLAAYQTLRPWVEDKQVTLTCDVAPGEWCTTDPYDRYLTYLIMDDGKDAATEMARAGAAFSYTSFATDKRADICRAEYDARDHTHAGMWALGTEDQVLAGMHADTRSWYRSQHDKRCDEAIAADPSP